MRGAGSAASLAFSSRSSASFPRTASDLDPHRILRIMLVVAMSAGLVMFVNAWSGFGGFAGILIPLFCFISSHGFRSGPAPYPAHHAGGGDVGGSGDVRQCVERVRRLRWHSHPALLLHFLARLPIWTRTVSCASCWWWRCRRVW